MYLVHISRTWIVFEQGVGTGLTTFPLSCKPCPTKRKIIFDDYRVLISSSYLGKRCKTQAKGE
ncbi:MAG TPA: hypothetical protein PKX92_04440 [Edaphocola sp.]|nr:hypothetical protein [Edaphocola sp.]